LTLTLAAAQPDAPDLVDDDGPLIPPVPEVLEHTGLTETMVEELILKILFQRKDTIGRDLANVLGLPFSVIEGIIENLKRHHLVQVKGSLGMGTMSAIYSLSEVGREHAKDAQEANRYADRAPVPLYQYVDIVRSQRTPECWLTMEALKQAYAHMVVTPEILSQIGPAVNSGKSFLIYGKPGNGKTYLAEALFKLHEDTIFLPYALECQGEIIQIFDPVYHNPEPDEDVGAFTTADLYDKRWFRTRRPFIESGGELTLEMLDLSFNTVGRFYDAPLQLKANNGIYLIDDFGRQKASPTEVLNRWIVPMERGIDYLRFENGTKMTVPSETFLVFSTNLQPDQLGDEAFLRRIQYKMLMPNPREDEFAEIFRRFANMNSLPYPPELLDWFVEKRYRQPGKPRRRCHPRDVLTHAIDLIRFERRPMELTEELLDHAFDSCFLAIEEED
jgi:MoxR-like ATPase